MNNHYPLFLASTQTDTTDILEVTDKYHGIALGSVARADHSMLEQAIVAGQRAEKEMRLLQPYQKQQILHACIEKIKQRFDDFVHILITESGKPRTFAVGEVTRLINTFELTADTVTTIPQGEVMPLAVTSASDGYRGMTQSLPVGLCAFITPFNFPLNLVAHKIAPAIAAGCPFILKPASSTPISALMLGEILAEVFAEHKLPKGAFSVLPMQVHTADTLVTDTRIQLLSFTGSDTVGWDMKARAGKKKVVLELGGNASVIVEPDTDLSTALPRIIGGAYAHAGQVCISVQRVLIHADIYDEVKKQLVLLTNNVKVGDPNDSDTVIGAMISTKEQERAILWLADATKKGATLLCGGKKTPSSIQATLLEDVTTDAHLHKDEAFAPIMILEKYHDFSEAIEMVNNSRFGLQVGVYTQNINKTMQAWNDIDAGGVIINDVPTFRVDNMPYGGIKDSGFGREGIRYAIEDMSETRLLVIKS